jgi:hypothetical protein
LVNQSSAGSGQYFTYFIGTISNNTQTTYTDTTADSSINTNTAQYSYRKSNTTAGQLFVQNIKTLFSDSYNTVFGSNAYSSANNRGNSTVAIGTESLRDNTTGTNNVSVGYASSFRTSGGSDNVSVGFASNYFNPDGAFNVAIGSGSLRSNSLTLQSYNTTIGGNSMFTSNGNYNSILGYYSGRNLSGSNNTFIGSFAGFYSSTKPLNYNIFIGNQVGNSLTGNSNMSNNILIGYGVNPPDLGGSNQLNIGNLIYGSSLGNSSTQSTGGVGIGVTNIGSRLDVSPTAAQIGLRVSGSSSTDMVRITQTGSGNALVVEDVGNPDSSPFVIDSSGNVGIGTTTPQAPLFTRGNFSLGTGGASPTYGAFNWISSLNTFTFRNASGDRGVQIGTNVTLAGGGGTVGGVISGVAGTGIGGLVLNGSTPADLTSSKDLVITNTGNIGIGTTSPDSILHVHNSSAGSVTPIGGTVVTIENSTTNYLSMLAPNGNYSGIVFGSPADSFGAYIRWRQTDGFLDIATADNADYIRLIAGNDNLKAYLTTNGFGVNTQPVASAALEISATTQGFLPPRMTNAQITSIATPATGLMAYSTTDNLIVYYNGSNWMKITGVTTL